MFFFLTLVIAQSLITAPELAVLTGTPTKEAQAKMEIHSETAEVKISKLSVIL